jgi:hypothetical protein
MINTSAITNCLYQDISRPIRIVLSQDLGLLCDCFEIVLFCKLRHSFIDWNDCLIIFCKFSLSFVSFLNCFGNYNSDFKSYPDSMEYPGVGCFCGNGSKWHCQCSLKWNLYVSPDVCNHLAHLWNRASSLWRCTSIGSFREVNISWGMWFPPGMPCVDSHEEIHQEWSADSHKETTRWAPKLSWIVAQLRIRFEKSPPEVCVWFENDTGLSDSLGNLQVNSEITLAFAHCCNCNWILDKFSKSVVAMSDSSM